MQQLPRNLFNPQTEEDSGLTLLHFIFCFFLFLRFSPPKTRKKNIFEPFTPFTHFLVSCTMLRIVPCIANLLSTHLKTLSAWLIINK